LYWKVDEGKLKRDSINKYWVGKSLNYFVDSYLNFRYLNLNIVQKSRETLVFTYKMKTGWGSFSKSRLLRARESSTFYTDPPLAPPPRQSHRSIFS
jgi:hypothetical protein